MDYQPVQNDFNGDILNYYQFSQTSNNLPQQSNQNYNNGQQQFFSSNKPKGLNLYQIPIFTIYNPRSATTVFYINTKSNDVGIMMAPAIPNNPAISIRGPVPNGIKVYDYDKKVFSNFSDVEIIDFVEFLKSKFVKDLSTFKSVIVDSNIVMNEIKTMISTLITPDFFNQAQQNPTYGPQIYEALQKILMKLNELKLQNDQLLNDSNNKRTNEDSFGLYRKGSSGDKGWMFNYDSKTNMLHINVKVNNDKINTTLSDKMALRLLSALESYTSNFSTTMMIANLSAELSKTLAFNKILAPSKDMTKNFD